MNNYFQNLEKIEFVVTFACTGHCKHCQNGEQNDCSQHIDAEVAEKSIREICENYKITSIMTFGGEPLLYPDVVYTIHRTATEIGIEKKQIITNGYFSKNNKQIEEVSQNLAKSGVNDLLLSVDAFHQETIPLEPVIYFAECAVKAGLPIRLHPAWLVSREDNNPYNVRTRELFKEFEFLNISLSSGNIISPQGNALKYFAEYFNKNVTPSSNYDEDPRDVKAISFGANGDVLNGNVYKTDILELIRTYQP